MNYLTESKGVEGTFLLHQLIRLADQLQVEVVLTRGMKEMETSSRKPHVLVKLYNKSCLLVEAK